MAEGATTNCLVSLYDRRAPPEIGTKGSEVGEPRPGFHWYNCSLLTSRWAAALSAMARKILSLSDPIVRMLESAPPASPCREKLLVSLTDSHPLPRSTRPAIWGLTASNSTSWHYGPFQRPSALAPRFVFGIPYPANSHSSSVMLQR